VAGEKVLLQQAEGCDSAGCDCNCLHDVRDLVQLNELRVLAGLAISNKECISDLRRHAALLLEVRRPKWGRALKLAPTFAQLSPISQILLTKIPAGAAASGHTTRLESKAFKLIFLGILERSGFTIEMFQSF
jgi:hypothetical protein